jgi:hypothetical protein
MGAPSPLAVGAVALLLLHLNARAVEAQESPALGCDSEDELLAHLRWLHDACSQAGESFAEADALVPSAVTTRGCAEVVRRVAHECDGLLLRSPVWFAGRKAALDAAVASAAAIPDGVDDVYHISDPSLDYLHLPTHRTIHTCGAVLDDGFARFPTADQSRVAIDVGPSRGGLRLSFEDLTLDAKGANDNLRLYSDEEENDELRAIFHDDLPLAGPISPIDISGSAVYVLLVSDGASRHTSFRVTIGCVCEDSAGFVDADGDGCEAYAAAKHGLCADLITADREARSACPLACGACEAGPCDVSPCQNGGTCTESSADSGHRRMQGGGDGYGGSVACEATDLADRSAAVNAACCDELAEDCSSGAPTTCNAGCSEVLVPFYQDCATALQQVQGGYDFTEAIQTAVLLCDESVGVQSPVAEYQCLCVDGWSGENCETQAGSTDLACCGVADGTSGSGSCNTAMCSACSDCSFTAHNGQPITSCMLQLNYVLRMGVCVRHGICDGSGCTCFAGYQGPTCETQVPTSGGCCSHCPGTDYGYAGGTNEFGQPRPPGWDCSNGACVCGTNQIINVPMCCEDASECNHAC